MSNPYYKNKQERATVIDSLFYRKKILKLIRQKKEGGSCLSINERDSFMDDFYYAVLSLGVVKCNVPLPDGNKVKQFYHLAEFAEYMCDLQDTEVVMEGQNIKISYLWEQLEKKIKLVFAEVMREAIHMSRETPTREMPSSFSFGADNPIGEK